MSEADEALRLAQKYKDENASATTALFAPSDRAKLARAYLALRAECERLREELSECKKGAADCEKSRSNLRKMVPELQSALALAMAECAAMKEVLLIARSAICSIGSFDPGLQNHYQQKLNQALKE